VGKWREPEEAFDEASNEKVWKYLVKVRVAKKSLRAVADEVVQRQFRHVLAVLTRCAESEGWKVLAGVPASVIVGSKEAAAAAEPVQEPTVEELLKPPRPPLVLPEWTEEAMATYFEGVYDRDSHVRVIHDATVNFARSMEAWREDPTVEVNRSHVLLKGKPAGAKTTVFERLKVWYGEHWKRRLLWGLTTT